MTHATIDQRSLAFDRLIAERIRRDPRLLGVAQANVACWMLTCSPRGRSTLLEWDRELRGTAEAVAALLEATDERATRLRQSNPFAGVLTPQERNAILRRFQADEPPAA